MQGPLHKKTTLSILASFALLAGCSGDTNPASGESRPSMLGEAQAALPPAEPLAPPEPEFLVHEETVQPGDALVVTLARAGLVREDANDIVSALSPLVNMRRIQPGDIIAVTQDDLGQPLSVEYRRSIFDRYAASPDAQGDWGAEKIDVVIETTTAVIDGTIEGSLYETMGRIGESPVLSNKLADIFEWDFDFRTHTSSGDRFRMVVDLDYVAGEFIGYGNIRMAQYETQDGRLLTAIGFEHPETERWAYYDASGHSVQKMFLRAPLNYKRISSGYTHARRHPVTGHMHPHLAIDYAAPRGTPVRSVAVGTVTAAGWKGGNGKSVLIRHPRGYETMYNHLSRVSVRRGQRVQQGDIIGKVGSTGLATGAHLDYRVRKNGRWVNPLNEKFVPGDPVPASSRHEFQAQLASLERILDREAPLTVDGAPMATASRAAPQTQQLEAPHAVEVARHF